MEYSFLVLQKSIIRNRDKREFERVIRIEKGPLIISHEELLTNWRFLTWRKYKGDDLMHVFIYVKDYFVEIT